MTPRRRTPEQLAQLIAAAIREGEFGPGEPLVQDDLARRFTVSRSPVREALRILAGQGLVDMPPGAGASVRSRSLDDLQELYDLRLLVETHAAAHIIDGATRGRVDRLATLAERMVETDDVHSWSQLNYEFHCGLYALAERPNTERIMRDLLTSVQPYAYENVSRPESRRQADAEHVLLIDQLRSHDVSGYAATIAQHLGFAREQVAARYS